jgi:molybdopterin/thiamine biosynthesis adenylyltransferase
MAVNPLVEVDAVQADLAAENAMELLAGCDVAVDCLDNIPARLVLQQAAKVAGVTVVHGAVAGWLGRICVIQPGEDLLSLLYPNPEEAQGEERQRGTLSFTAALTASWQAAETVKLLLGKPGLQGEILEVDLLQAIVRKLKIS